MKYAVNLTPEQVLSSAVESIEYVKKPWGKMRVFSYGCNTLRNAVSKKDLQGSSEMQAWTA